MTNKQIVVTKEDLLRALKAKRADAAKWDKQQAAVHADHKKAWMASSKTKGTRVRHRAIGGGSMIRYQRTRRKGDRLPEGVRYVGRPTKWGNPYYVQAYRYSEHTAFETCVRLDEIKQSREGLYDAYYGRTGRTTATLAFSFEKADALSNVVSWYSFHAITMLSVQPDWLDELRDAKGLACWCPLDQPCHADVLIELLTEGAAQ